MKQLLFLLLFPCLVMAQYPANGNQKISLGEQTTADGLVFRGLAADTTRKPSVDTMAYILLDTNTNIIWQYKKATNNAWTRVGGSISSGITGTLPVANGGTNAGAFTSGSVVFAGSSGTYTQDNSGLFYDNTNDRLGIGTASPGYKLDVNGTGRFSGDININKTGSSSILFLSNGDISSINGTHAVFLEPQNGGKTSYFGRENSTGTWVFNTAVTPYSTIISAYNSSAPIILGHSEAEVTIANGGATTFSSSVTATTGIFTNYAGGGTTGASIDNTGQIVRTSSIELKKDITNIKYGLNEILQINPINFNWIDENKFGNENENGFIAEDVMSIIPNVVGSDANGLFMDYTKIIPILTKAIQEQNALIKALEQRILILENK